MIKAVIFDVGGVILYIENLFLPVKEAFQPEDMEIFWQELNESFSPLCRGEGDLLNFWKDLAKKHNKNIPENTLKKLWIDEFEQYLIINEEVKKIIIELKKKYKLAILSNTIKEHADLLKKNESFKEVYALFDVVIFSNEVKMAKDNKDIFLFVLKKLKLTPEECIFTDDTKKFVDVAKSVGINAVQFKSVKQFKEELNKLGIFV